MKKIIFFALIVVALSACMSNEKTTWDKYASWRNANESWVKEMQSVKNEDGTPYYDAVIPTWNPGIFVLVHYFNDRAETEGNLSPLYNSTVDVCYRLHNMDGEQLDSSLEATLYGEGVARFRLDQTIQGWAAAMQDMRCGDTAEVVVPWGAAYGSSEVGDIKPFSALRFNIRLIDIPYYQIPN